MILCSENSNIKRTLIRNNKNDYEKNVFMKEDVQLFSENDLKRKIQT